MQENFPTFRGMLRAAICNRTQAQFANESGISAGHLNRMLNSDVIARPSRQTLHKIAAAAKNGITYKLLNDALDEDDPEYNPAADSAGNQIEPSGQTEADSVSDFRTKARTVLQAIHDKLAEQGYPIITKSIQTHIDGVIQAATAALNEPLPVSYDISRVFDYIAGEHDYAKQWLSVTLTMADRELTAESEIVVFFSETAGANHEPCYIVHLASTEVCDIIDVRGMPPMAMAAYPDADDGAAFEKALLDPFYLGFQKTKRFTEASADENLTPERRLLLALFGDDTPYSNTIEGFGFWLEQLPPRFAEFISAHKDTAFAQYLNQTRNYATLEQALNDALKSGDGQLLADAMDSIHYSDTDSISDSGWGATIAHIMTQETGFPYCHYKHTPPEKNPRGFIGLSERNCILLPADEAACQHIQREAVLRATLHYAKELGLTEFGDLMFTSVETSSTRHRTYRIRTPEQAEAVRQQRLTENPEPAEPDYSVPFDSDHHPDADGLYAVELKDGRHMQCVYLTQHNIWIALHKEWSVYIKAYDPRPLRPDIR